MKPRRIAPLAFAMAVLASAVSAQVTVYPGGDGTTNVVRGNPFCGTSPVNLNSLDAVNHSIAASSEFALCGLNLRGGVARPMGGRNQNQNNGFHLGATVVNGTSAPVTVTQVVFATTGAPFRNAAGVKPAAGWAVAGNNTLTWTGTAIVPAGGNLDFIVRSASNRQAVADQPLTIGATTSRGPLTEAGVFFARQIALAAPMVSLNYVEGSATAFAANLSNGGQVETGVVKSFRVRVQESENAQPIPAGTLLTVDVPPGWSLVTAGVGPFTVTNLVQPTPCAPGQISATMNAGLTGGIADFTFTSVSPPNLGATGNFQFNTRLTNAAAQIDAQIEYMVQVDPPPEVGAYAGLTAVEAFAIVAHPMGDKKSSVMGAVLANPTDLLQTVTQVQLLSTSGGNPFKDVIGLKPATGWTRVSANEIQWTGTLEVDPRRGRDFLALVQANNRNITTPIPIEVRITTPTQVYVNTRGTTIQRNGPSASVYYLTNGESGYVHSVINGQPHTFTAAVEEQEGGKLKKGSFLRIAIPAGWSNVVAPGQGDFDPPTILQPTPGTPGEILARLKKDIHKEIAPFSFTVTAPSLVRKSLYMFRTTLENTAEGYNALCEAIVQTVEVGNSGIEVTHLSPPIAGTGFSNITIQYDATSIPPMDYAIQIMNFATMTWETIATPTFDATVLEVTHSITSNFDSYFDPSQRILIRVFSTDRTCHGLNEDLLNFLVSRFYMTSTTLAPPTSVQGTPQVPMQQLRFVTETGQVLINSITVTATGTNPLVDVAGVRLFADSNCDGFIQPTELQIGSGPLDPQARITFSGAPLLTAALRADACAIITFDISSTAIADNLIAASITSGSDITTSIGPYPVYSTTGYAAASDETLILLSDSDLDGITDANETGCTNPLDADTDDDGLLDGEEFLLYTDPCNPDTDRDLLPDGLEEGRTAFTDLTDTDGDNTPDIVDPNPALATVRGTNAALFVPDLDPSTTTDPTDDDNDDDGLFDGPVTALGEDMNINGRADVFIGETGTPGTGETDPSELDTDGDACQDGTELGLTAPEATMTLTPPFQLDLDPAIVTNPRDTDTDDDGQADGVEDADCNGAIDPGETDPTMLPYCGDLITDPNELCDQGAVNTAACDADCSGVQCGDGFFNPVAGEQCDAGAQTNTCDIDCTFAMCQDGLLNVTAGELCDDGAESAACDTNCTPASCGDGTLNVTAGEACDGGGATPTCDLDCTLAVCGDGLTNDVAGENCDDGNTNPGDGCSATCRLEVCGNGVVDFGEDCDTTGETAACDANCTLPVCGDSTLNVSAGEICDQGGPTASCDSDCTLPLCGDGLTNAAAGELCDGAGETAVCDADCTLATCGDGIVNTTAGEGCDDAGESAACNQNCTVTACGDGITNVAAGEQCDTSGQSITCDLDCTFAACGDGVVNASAGETCDTAGESATCDFDCSAPLCGDAHWNPSAGELCDGGSETSTCDLDCTTAMCGDGVVNDTSGEICDDGNSIPGDGCNSICYPEGCGNGVVDLGEQCDDFGESATCDLDCTTAMCGDAFLNLLAGEICDDGRETANCDADCTEAMCGDGVANGTAGELCDDSGESATCDNNCTLAVCGDNTVNPTAGELCDTAGQTASCDANCTLVSCGDGDLNTSAGEGCDDGNVIACDGCDGVCRPDPPTLCGDGVLVCGEQCDDAGETSTCDLNCTLAVCGDGTVNGTAGEACDDGNTTSGDGCSAVCISECATGTLPRVVLVLAVKAPVDVATFSWTAVAAPEAHVNYVGVKAQLLDPTVTGNGTTDCITTVVSCTVTTPYVAVGVRYYQVLAACNATIEGPF